MRIIVVIVDRGNPGDRQDHTPDIQARVADALSDPPWGANATTRQDEWISKSQRVCIGVATNEPSTTGELIHRFGDGSAAAWSGHIDELAFGERPPALGDVADLPGRFAVVFGDDDCAVGHTMVHRMEPLYVADRGRHLAIATRATSAYRAIGAPPGQVPREVLLSLAGAGFMLNDLTPFPGVHAVPADSSVTASVSGIQGRRHPPTQADPDINVSELAGEVADALSRSAVAIGRMPWTLVVHITGGKDSRLAAAALASAGVAFGATTSGVDTHPDVVIGRMVAARLGVDHQVRPPAGTTRDGDVVEVWPLRRAYEALRGCEGMITAYETISLRGPYREGSVTLGGHGGELLRGGFAYGVPRADSATVLRRFENRVAPHRSLLAADAQAELDSMVEPWIEQLTVDPHGASERFYREFRTGRWHAVANSIYSIGGPRRSILADNRVVRLVSSARQEAAAEERLVHEVLHELRADLCSLPMYPKRWNFEALDGDSTCQDGPSGFPREVSANGASAWNWKVSYPPELHRHLADSILMADQLYDDLFNRSKVEKLLTDTLYERTPMLAQRVWALYTASLLVDGLGFDPQPPDGPVVRIPLPN